MLLSRTTALLLLVARPATTGAASGSANLIRDPNFETLAAWGSCPPSEFSRVTDVVRAPAAAAMRQSNDDASDYHTCTQVVKGAAAGRRYKASVWVKSANISGTDSGATLCVEFAGKSGYIRGSYPKGVKGATDWTQVTSVAQVPMEATSVSLSVYTRKGMTGTAWSDRGAQDRASPSWGWPLASLGLDIGIFCDFLYSVLILRAVPTAGLTA
jgi:hypothetical protein